MKPLPFALALTLALLAAPVVRAGKLADSLHGLLVRYDQGTVVPAAADALAGKKLIAVYYSAHWCPPCRAFTPELVKFYNDTKAAHPEFELIFVSSDKSVDEMKGYMAWGKMPWLALDYSKRRVPVLASLAARGIPYLIVLDADGQPLVVRPAGEDWMSPSEALVQLKKLLARQ